MLQQQALCVHLHSIDVVCFVQCLLAAPLLLIPAMYCVGKFFISSRVITAALHMQQQRMLICDLSR
jgi:hypothetical protein